MESSAATRIFLPHRLHRMYEAEVKKVYGDYILTLNRRMWELTVYNYYLLHPFTINLLAINVNLKHPLLWFYLFFLFLDCHLIYSFFSEIFSYPKMCKNAFMIKI